MTVPPLAETVASFDARSATYDDSGMHRAFAAAAIDACDPQDGETLLDLAGGTGLVARAALTRLGTGRAIVLDASPGMLREARRQDDRLTLLRADVHHVPLRDDAVDRTTCVTALHLFHEPARALREAARTCRPGGTVVFTTWAVDGWSTARVLREAARQHGVDLPDRQGATGTADGAAHLARSAGLDPVEVAEARHVAPRTEDADATWARLTATAPPLPAAVRDAFHGLLGDEVEHRILLVTCRPA